MHVYIFLCVFMVSDLSETEVIKCLETESNEQSEKTQLQSNSVQLVAKRTLN